MTRPDWRRERRSPLRALLRGRNVETDIDDELSFHLEMRVRQLVEQGLSEDEARRTAERRFGDAGRVRTECATIERRQAARRIRADGLAAFLRDIRLAVRTARRDPAVSILCIAAIGLGIGVTAAAFSVAHGVLSRRLPYPDPDRLVELHAAVPGGTRYGEFSPAEVAALRGDGLARRENGDATRVAGHSMSRRALTAPGTEPTELTLARVTDGFFEVFGRPTLLGRTPVTAEYAGGAPVVVLSHALWTTRFGADEAAIGSRVSLGGEPHTVIGVMPPQFGYPEDAGLWRPLTLDERADDDRELRAIARLSPQTGIAPATAAFERRLAGYQTAAGVRADERRELWTEPARASLVRAVRAPILALLGTAGLVLLIASVNVANLLLARADARSDQNATRQALGASRGGLVRQHLAESLVISGVGCALGLLLGRVTLPTLLRVAPAGTPRLSEVSLDGRVVLVMSLVALVTTLISGSLPAARAVQTAPARLASSSRRFSSGRGRVLRGLVTAQVALSTLLVLGAGLLGASFIEMMRFDRGFATEGILVVPLSLTGAATDRLGVREAYGEVLEETRVLPGVRDAHLVSHAPDRARGLNLRLIRPRGLREEAISAASLITVSPGWFETAGVPLLEGRGFAETDDEDAPVVAVVSRSFAARVLPPGPAVGARFHHGLGPDGTEIEVTVVGVAGDVRPDPAAEPAPVVYLPNRQLFGASTLVVRTDGDPTTVLPALRERIWAVDPDVPLDGAYTLADAVAGSMASPRFYFLVIGVFAGLATLLATVGVYGVTSYGVTRRAREIGLRSAMGADTRHIVGHVLRDALRPVLIGVAVGLCGAAALSRAAAAFLFGVRPLEPGVYLAVAVVLGTAGLLAALVPARRAARLDPLAALRRE